MVPQSLIYRIERYFNDNFLEDHRIYSWGVKSFSLAALIQSKFYGGYIAKGSLFSYLQSVGATCWFDPTLFTFFLLGGTLFYYFYRYKYCESSQKLFELDIREIMTTIPSVTVPKSVTYSKGKFDIEWKKLTFKESQDWKKELFKQPVSTQMK